MNSITTLPSPFARQSPPSTFPSAPATHAAGLDRMQSRFGLRIASRLSEQADALGPDITERLRFAREQALTRARASRGSVAEAGLVGNPIGLQMSGGGRTSAGWRLKLAAAIPVLALLGGLFLIQDWQDNAQISVAAEIDAALLSDDLPPTAYSDAGFVEYLKTPAE